MTKIKVVLAGESWVSSSTHFKGWDFFSSTIYETGIEYLEKAFQGTDIKFSHMPNHIAAKEFPLTIDELQKYDVVFLSDIGANTLLLHPDTWIKGRSVKKRLQLLAEWVEEGRKGGCLFFDGEKSQVVIPMSPSLSIDKEIEIEAWIYPTKNTSFGGIVSNLIWSNPRGWQLHRGNFGKIWFGISHDGKLRGESFFLKTDKIRVPLNTWSHIKAVFDGKEAKIFMQELRLIMRYLEVSEAEMEKGQLRCEKKQTKPETTLNYFPNLRNNFSIKKELL